MPPIPVLSGQEAACSALPHCRPDLTITTLAEEDSHVAGKQEEQQRQKEVKAKEAKSEQEDAARQKDTKDKGKKSSEPTK